MRYCRIITCGTRLVAHMASARCPPCPSIDDRSLHERRRSPRRRGKRVTLWVWSLSVSKLLTHHRASPSHVPAPNAPPRAEACQQHAQRCLRCMVVVKRLGVPFASTPLKHARQASISAVLTVSVSVQQHTCARTLGTHSMQTHGHDDTCIHCVLNHATDRGGFPPTTHQH